MSDFFPKGSYKLHYETVYSVRTGNENVASVEKCKILMNYVNELLKLFFVEDQDGKRKVNRSLLEYANLGDEPVNWASVCATDVAEIAGRASKEGEDDEEAFIVFIDGAGPEAHRFKKYLEDVLRRHGWETEVVLAW